MLKTTSRAGELTVSLHLRCGYSLNHQCFATEDEFSPRDIFQDIHVGDFDHQASLATERLRAEGWRLTPVYGWICPNAVSEYHEVY